jgi:hypothetical protein
VIRTGPRIYAAPAFAKRIFMLGCAPITPGMRVVCRANICSWECPVMAYWGLLDSGRKKEELARALL